MFEYGPWFIVNVAHSYIFLLVGMALLIRIATRSPQLLRWQGRLLMAGVAVPFLTNVGYVFNLIPLPGVDLTPLSLATLGLAASITLFEIRLLDDVLVRIGYDVGPLCPISLLCVVGLIRDKLTTIESWG